MNNQENIWNTLEIDPTHDEGVIRKAYATLSKSIHPEENPTEFLTLKSAYEQAMDFAKEKRPLHPDTQKETAKEKEIDLATLSKMLDIPYSISKNLTNDYFLHDDNNPFDSPIAKEELANHPAILSLLALKDQEDATRDQWMTLFTSHEFLEIFFHHGLSSYFTSAVTAPGEQFRIVFFLAYQLNPQINDPCPPPIAQAFTFLSIMMVTVGMPELSREEQAFAEAFRSYVLLTGHSTKTTPPEKIWKRTLSSFQKYTNPEEIKHWDDILSYYLLKNEIPSAPQDLVETFHLYSHSPMTQKYPGISRYLQENHPDLRSRPPEHWETLGQYLENFQNLLEITPENQQNKLAFIRPFFDHAPLLDLAIYDPDFMAKKQFHNLVTSTKNRLFLAKCLELCQNNPNMLDYDFFLETIVTAIWEKEEPATTSRQQALQDMASQLIEEFTPKKTIAPKKPNKKKKKK